LNTHHQASSTGPKVLPTSIHEGDALTPAPEIHQVDLSHRLSTPVPHGPSTPKLRRTIFPTRDSFACYKNPVVNPDLLFTLRGTHLPAQLLPKVGIFCAAGRR
jgi:hypothetical protein